MQSKKEPQNIAPLETKTPFDVLVKFFEFLTFFDKLNFISTCRRFFFSGDKRLEGIKPLHRRISQGYKLNCILSEEQLFCLSSYSLPIQIPLNRVPVDMGCVDDCILILFNDGSIYYFDELASLAFSDEITNLSRLRIINLPDGVKAKQIAVGKAYEKAYSVILGEDGRVYGFGLDKDSKLLGIQKGETPARLKLFDIVKEPIIKIFAGGKQIFVIGDQRWVSSFQIEVDKINRRGHFLIRTQFDTKPVQIAVGSSFEEIYALVVCDNGRVCSSGANEYGQLGLEESDPSIKKFKLIALLSHVKIRKIVAGTGHSMALDEQGNVYVFGTNHCGQLGLGDTSPRSKPEHLPLQLPKDVIVVDIATKGYSSMVLCSNGDIFVFGANTFSGLVGSKNLLVPTKLPELTEKNSRLSRWVKVIERKSDSKKRKYVSNETDESSAKKIKVEETVSAKNTINSPSENPNSFTPLWRGVPSDSVASTATQAVKTTLHPN